MIINPLKINLYIIIIFLSVIIGMLYIYINIKKEIKQNKQILLYYMIYILFAFSFGKIYTSIIYFEKSFFEAGLSAYGGLIGVVLGSIIFEKIIPLNGKIITSTILSLPLVYGLTKIGCFISGCCYGIPYNGIFKVIYPKGLNIGVFPIQIVETIIFILMFIILNKFKDKKYINYICLLFVSIFKFLLDFLRYDHINKIITGNQIFSIVLFLLVIFIFIYKKKKSLIR